MTLSDATSALAVSAQAIQKGQQQLAFVKQKADAEKAVANMVTDATNELSSAQGRGRVIDITV